jgi:hypothetical protein
MGKKRSLELIPGPFSYKEKESKKAILIWFNLTGKDTMNAKQFKNK